MKMKYASIAVRVLMGLIFFGSGVAFFFMTPPPQPEGPMATFFNGLVASGYFLTLLKVTEIACGLMLLSGFFVPLALVILAPIVLNIFFVHTLLAPEGVIIAVVLAAFQIFLSFFSIYSPRVRQLFRP